MVASDICDLKFESHSSVISVNILCPNSSRFERTKVHEKRSSKSVINRKRKTERKKINQRQRQTESSVTRCLNY